MFFLYSSNTIQDNHTAHQPQIIRVKYNQSEQIANDCRPFIFSLQLFAFEAMIDRPFNVFQLGSLRMKCLKKAQKCSRCSNFQQQTGSYYHPFGLDMATCPECYKWQCEQSTNFKKNRIKLFPQLVEIIPGLFLSNQDAALDLSFLQKHDIKNVCACGYFLQTPHAGISYKQFLVGDYAEQDIRKYFSQSNEWIQQRMKENSVVLVHCSAGVSRSVSFIIAYLIGKLGMSFEEAFQSVRNKRSVSNPNHGFVEQLKQYAKQQ